MLQVLSGHRPVNIIISSLDHTLSEDGCPELLLQDRRMTVIGFAACQSNAADIFAATTDQGCLEHIHGPLHQEFLGF